MKKEFIKIGSALVILVGLILTVWWHRKGEEEKNTKEEAEQKVVKINLDEVKRYVITNKEGEIRMDLRTQSTAKGAKPGDFDDPFAPLDREIDRLVPWKISAPFQDLPDAYSTETLKKNLGDLKTTKTISEKGEKPADYQLAQPPLTIQLFSDSTDKPALTVRVGDDNPAGTSTYIQTSASPGIYLTDTSLNYLKSRKPYEWRKKEIIGFRDSNNVKALQVAVEKKPVISLERNGKNWMMKEPQKLPADRATVENFLTDIKNLRHTAVVSEDAKHDGVTYGLPKPYATYTLTVETPSGTVKKKIVIGSKTGANKEVYASRTDFPQVYALASHVRASLTKDSDYFIFKTPLELEESKLTNIVIMQGDKRTELAKKDGKWSLTAPTQLALEDAKVNPLIWKLIQLKGNKYIGSDISAVLKKIPPIYEITVTAGDQKKSLALYQKDAKSDAEGKGGDPSMAYTFHHAELEALASRIKDVLTPASDKADEKKKDKPTEKKDK